MEAAFATVYERNLFYQQVSFKWRSFLHLRTNVGALQWARDGWLRDMLFTIAFCFTHLLDFVFGCGLLMLLYWKSSSWNQIATIHVVCKM